MDKIKTLYFYSVVAVIVTVPYFDHLNSILIAVLCLFSLLSSSFSDKLTAIKANPWVVLFILYYCLQFMGFLNSENTKEALFILEKKGGMALIPLFLVTGNKLNKLEIRNILFALISSVVIGGLFMFSLASIEFLSSGNTSIFFYHELANQLDTHAIYFSVYVSISLLLLMKYKDHFSTRTTLFFVPTLFLWILLILLSSKTVFIITLVLVSIFLKSPNSFLKKSNLKYGLLIPLFGIVIFASVGSLKSRYAELSGSFESLYENVIQGDKKYKYDTELNGLTLRVTIWKIVTQIVSEDWETTLLGVGTGDAQDELQKAYVRKGLYTGNPEFNDRGYLDYNAHSQYFQELLRNGIIGLSILILLIISLIVLLKENRIAQFILLVFIFFFLTESGLERHTGCILFTLLTSLLLLNRRATSIQ